MGNRRRSVIGSDHLRGCSVRGEGVILQYGEEGWGGGLLAAHLREETATPKTGSQ